MDRIDELFGEVRMYPGSRHPIPDRRPEIKPPPEPEAWDAHPTVNQGVEYFTIGQLASALGRAPASIRSWEEDGIIPQARYRTASRNRKKAKRLYTRAQVEGIVRIAQEEGLMALSRAGGPRRGRIPATFVQRVHALFKTLEAKS